ncbi:MAG: family 43 glycosylhydrolase, partial [Bacteroidales bacterium]|nr:family 43 glycosylhydrolase [Bacteroidales bacterium]
SDGPIFKKIDLSVFEDDYGDVYALAHNHFIAKMKDDLSGLAEEWKRLKQMPYKPEPYIEGVYIVKHNGKYQLMQTVWSVDLGNGNYTYVRKKGTKNSSLVSYDVVIAESENIYGPYGQRYPAILQGGHNNIFKDADGKWWSTTFFNPKGKMGQVFEVTCRPAVVAVKWVNGKLMIDHERNIEFYKDIR